MADRVLRWLASPGALPRLAVLGCVALATTASLIRYPQALAELNRTARDNAALTYSDREFAGGNSVVPDQEELYQARARIPRESSYEVAVGEPIEGWSELTKDHVVGFTMYFLQPRRPKSGAPWVICFNCDRSRYPGKVVWENEDAVSIIRRAP